MSFSKTALTKFFKTKNLTANTVNQTSWVTLTDAATIVIDASQGNQFSVTLGGNRTLGIILNPAYDGQDILLRIQQDSTGSRTLTLTTSGAGSFGFGTSPASITLSTASSKTDYLRVRYNLAANKFHVIAFQAGF